MGLNDGRVTKHASLIGSRAELNPWRGLCALAKNQCWTGVRFFYLGTELSEDLNTNYPDCRVICFRRRGGGIWRYDAGEFEEQGREKRKGVASLFDDYEIKDLFKVCSAPDRGGGADLSGLLGLSVGHRRGRGDGQAGGRAFSLEGVFSGLLFGPGGRDLSGRDRGRGLQLLSLRTKGGPVFKDTSAEGVTGKLVKVANFCFQLPFLLTLLLLGIFIGVVYNLGAIMEYLARFGEAASRVVLIGLGCVLVAGTIFGVVRMVLNYKLRKKNMEYDYKREVMERLGIAILDERTMIDSRARWSGRSTLKSPRRIQAFCLPDLRRSAFVDLLGLN
jgi:hypothetical protein